jgi:hypothetical protein
MAKHGFAYRQNSPDLSGALLRGPLDADSQEDAEAGLTGYTDPPRCRRLDRHPRSSNVSIRSHLRKPGHLRFSPAPTPPTGPPTVYRGDLDHPNADANRR